MLIVLNYRAFWESPLPHVPTAPMKAMVPLCVRHQQALHHSADGARQWANDQMDVIRHQAVAIKFERLPLLQIASRLEKGKVVSSEKTPAVDCCLG